ncbi:hypothetical protein FPOA_00721 [Fusarium poae]|jgi:TolA-binding protein|uniref:Uncharacterized protein n=1 Tax=Fusarium poae TaxID=36050 RepID=A0A1B8B238_FUSPO|nr:hypothetical protein FPOA_00721 [Fusarium poae]
MDPCITTTTDKGAFERTKLNRRFIVEHRQLALEDNGDKIALLLEQICDSRKTTSSAVSIEPSSWDSHSDVVERLSQMQEKIRNLEKRFKNTEREVSILKGKSRIKLKAEQLENKSINMEHLSNDIADRLNAEQVKEKSVRLTHLSNEVIQRLNAEHVKEKSVQLKHLSAEVIQKLERDSSPNTDFGFGRPRLNHHFFDGVTRDAIPFAPF